MKKTQHTAEIINEFNRSFVKFMQPANEKTDAEENKFRMPVLPVLTLNGVMEKPTDNETKQPEVHKND